MKVLIVGTGIAGLTSALTLAGESELTIVTKSAATAGNTHRAQGGIAAVTSAEDAVGLHAADTLTAGAGWSDAAAVEVLCGEGPARIADLIEAGVRFDTADDGGLARGLEAAHSRARVLHAGGDATGAAISTALLAAAARAGAVVRERVLVTELLVEEGRVVGVMLMDLATGAVERHGADAVVLATGGAGQLYPYTSNPAVATGDGVALAARAGAGLADLEFYQFHPTTLALPGNFLISEAVRGEGAVLRDCTGERFMLAVHPDAELAPRDVVARAVAARMLATGAPVTLDATALGGAFLRRRFPSIDAAVHAAGLDWSREPVPVTPAAHYWMGGVATDLWGRTSVPGLLAVGEVACTGVHGANRLASNSLLEGAVFGNRAARALLGDSAAGESAAGNSAAGNSAAGGEPAGPGRPDLVYATALPAMAGGDATSSASTEAPRSANATSPAPAGAPQEANAPSTASAEGFGTFSRAALQQLMWTHAGLIRDETGLAGAETVLAGWAATAQAESGAPPDLAATLTAHENANLLLLARLLTHAARERTASLGAHFRSDARPADSHDPAALDPGLHGPAPRAAPSPALVLESH